MRNLIWSTALMGAAAVAPSGLDAQAVAPLRQSHASAAATAQFAAVAPAAEAAPVPTNVALVRSTKREGTILMIVGAAGIVTGLLTDESIITIAGAGAAGVGLYLYLREGGEIEIDP